MKNMIMVISGLIGLAANAALAFDEEYFFPIHQTETNLQKTCNTSTTQFSTLAEEHLFTIANELDQETKINICFAGKDKMGDFSPHLSSVIPAKQTVLINYSMFPSHLTSAQASANGFRITKIKNIRDDKNNSLRNIDLLSLVTITTNGFKLNYS